jgi:EpsI family protein
MSHARATVAVLLVLSAGMLARASGLSTSPRQAQLAALPYQVAAWNGRDAAPLDEAILRELSVDSYLNRTYTTGAGSIGLYIAYYGRQKPGVSIHSPLLCLPGTGWEPLDVATVDLGSGHARRLIVRKNRDRAVVLYWYAVHGRTIANEAISKAWLLHDSVRLRRTDAALVRIVVPVTDRDATTDAAEREAVAFARDVIPFLSNLWS